MSLSIPQEFEFDPVKQPRHIAHCPLCSQLPIQGRYLRAVYFRQGRRGNWMLWGCEHASAIDDATVSSDPEDLRKAWNAWALEAFATMADQRKYTFAKRGEAAKNLNLHEPDQPDTQ
jgi:hypothetical protein